MKANELRIGNLVNITYETKKDVADTCLLDYDYLSELARDHFVISHFSTDEINVFIGKEFVEFSLSEIEPIPLTAEWLEKFGFNSFESIRGYTGIEIKPGRMILDFVLTEPEFMGPWQKNYVFELGSNRFREIEYVHQLQNLFFALTGEELAIKEETK